MPQGVPRLDDYVCQSARRHPDQEALTTTGGRFTFGELDRAVSALAGNLVKRGLQRGDRVIVTGDGSFQTVVSFWAVIRSGGVAVMIHPKTPPVRLT